MKKTILTLMIVGFLVSFAVIGIAAILSDNKTLPRNSFTTEERTKLESLNINTFDYEDRSQGDKEIRKLTSTNDFNLPEISVKRTYESCTNFIGTVNLTVIDLCNEYETLNYTDKEMEDLLDEAMIQKMKQIANARIQRDSVTPAITREGSVVIGG